MPSEPPTTADGPVRLASVLKTFALSADLAFGLELEDGLRSCYVAMRIAEELHLSDEERLTVYYTSLLKDAGCTSPSPALAELFQTDEIAFRRDTLLFGVTSFMRTYFLEAVRRAGADLPLPSRAGTVFRIVAGGESPFVDILAGVSEVCARITQRLGLPASVQEAALTLTEQWDGKGLPNRLRGERIPLASRVVSPTFFAVPIHRVLGRDAAAKVVRDLRGKMFAPDVADAFLALAGREPFWEGLESPSIADLVLQLEPAHVRAVLDEAGIDNAALALADFIDFKSPTAGAHSRRVAAYARQIAQVVGGTPPDVTIAFRAALVHDLGIVGVPSYTIAKPDDRWTASDREAMRLHPYHGERILERAPIAPGLVSVVGAHHEAFDGSGYYRGLRGGDIPLGARVIAVAARLDELTQPAAGRAPNSLEGALDQLAAEGGTLLDPEIVDALLHTTGRSIAPPTPPRQWPAGLTPREVEVLRLASKGLTRRDVAGVLGITENTVRHHLEHIYNKTGTSTRVGATLFAMENDLLL